MKTTYLIKDPRTQHADFVDDQDVSCFNGTAYALLKRM